VLIDRNRDVEYVAYGGAVSVSRGRRDGDIAFVGQNTSYQPISLRQPDIGTESNRDCQGVTIRI